MLSNNLTDFDNSKISEKKGSKSAGDNDSLRFLQLICKENQFLFSAASGFILLFTFILDKKGAFQSEIIISLYLVSYFFGAYYLLREMVQLIKSFRFDIDFLMLVAAAGAAILGNWAEGGLLLFLFSLGHAFEHYASCRADSAISDLSKVTPKTALLKTDRCTEEVAVECLNLKEVVIIKPFAMIPVDGKVIFGSSNVEEATITGESLPVEKFPVNESQDCSFDKLPPNQRVFSGTFNGNGYLEVEVLKLAEDSTISKLIRLVHEAKSQKSQTQRFTEKFEKVFVPFVLVFVFALNFAFLFIDETFADSFYRAMSVLVVSSPCALVISTPCAVLSGVAGAARRGVLIKGGRPLELLGSLKAIAFDKTGTLTKGTPKLTSVIPWNETDQELMLGIVIAVEKQSEHPLAKAIVQDGLKLISDAVLPESSEFEACTGYGVKAKVYNDSIRIGKPTFFPEAATKLSKEQLLIIQELENRGETVMLVVKGEIFLGLLAVRDAARSESPKVLDQLRKLGIERIIMLTGDNQRVANAVAAEVGIEESWGNLLPEDKVQKS